MLMIIGMLHHVNGWEYEEKLEACKISNYKDKADNTETNQHQSISEDRYPVTKFITLTKQAQQLVPSAMIWIEFYYIDWYW